METGSAPGRRFATIPFAVYRKWSEFI